MSVIHATQSGGEAVVRLTPGSTRAYCSVRITGTRTARANPAVYPEYIDLVGRTAYSSEDEAYFSDVTKLEFFNDMYANTSKRLLTLDWDGESWVFTAPT